MQEMIRECIANFGPAPRDLSFWDRLTYFRVPTPSWLRQCPTDKLTIIFANLRSLFSEGVVVWGHVIQANALMFEDGNDDCPGELVYSLDAGDRADPQYLKDVAHQLYGLKNTEPTDPELFGIADYLTDEMTRVYGLPVPHSISPAHRCQVSTTYFVRKHLPGRRLCSSFLPVVVRPTAPFVAMPLPERYWPSDFAKSWVQ